MAVKARLEATATPHVLTIVESDVEKVEQLKEEVWKVRAPEIALKGFRKGQVPRSLAERQVGYLDLYREVLNQVLKTGVNEITDRIVGIENVSVELFQKDKPVALRATVWLEPKVHIGELHKGVKVEMDPVTLVEGEVEAVIQRMCEGAAIVEDVDREVQMGDLVTIDLDGKLADGTEFEGSKAEDASVHLGSGGYLEEFEQGLLGAKVGEEKEVPLTFPDSYPVKSLATKEAIFKVVVKAVQTKELPEIDDEFAKQVGYENLEDCRNKIGEDLLTNKTQQSKAMLDQKLLTQLITAVKIDPIPRCMIEAQIDSLINGLVQRQGLKDKEEYLKKAKVKEEDLRTQQEQMAFQDVRIRLILNKVADTQELVSTEEDRDQILKGLMPQHKDKTLEQLREQIDMNMVDSNVRVSKALDFIRSEAVVTDSVPTQPVQPTPPVEPEATE